MKKSTKFHLAGIVFWSYMYFKAKRMEKENKNGLGRITEEEYTPYREEINGESQEKA